MYLHLKSDTFILFSSFYSEKLTTFKKILPEKRELHSRPLFGVKCQSHGKIKCFLKLFLTFQKSKKYFMYKKYRNWRKIFESSPKSRKIIFNGSPVLVDASRRFVNKLLEQFSAKSACTWREIKSSKIFAIFTQSWPITQWEAWPLTNMAGLSWLWEIKKTKVV